MRIIFTKYTVNMEEDGKQKYVIDGQEVGYFIHFPQRMNHVSGPC